MVFWRKSNFNIFQKNRTWVNCLFILRFMFFIFRNLLAKSDTKREKDSAVKIRRIYFERNFSPFQSCFTHFIILISFAGNSVFISLYSVEFLHFLLTTILHWVHSKFYLFFCLSVFNLCRIWCTILQYLGLYFGV